MGRTIAMLMPLLAVSMACGVNPPVEGEPDPAVEQGLLVVYTVNYPLAYFAERIGGDRVDVVFPAPPGVDPASWSPGADIIAAYQGADLILLNGAGYARWVTSASLPESRLVDTGAAFVDRLIELDNVTTHSHGPEGEHEHRGRAFTTWLDIELATMQARAVADAFASARPEFTEEFNQRFSVLADELGVLDQRLADAAGEIGDRPLFFSHPVYQYLIRRYELNAHEVHWEPDETPNRHAWDHFELLSRSHPAGWMIWEREPRSETVARLAELGVASLVFDPCADVPAAGDFMSRMAVNATALESIAR